MLARRLLPADLLDSRALPDLAGRKIRLAGLVAHRLDPAAGRAASLPLLDEFGLVEVRLPGGVEAPAEAELVVAEAVVELHFGAPVVQASRAARWLPGVVAVTGERTVGAA
jgi:hypothetical protein